MREILPVFHPRTGSFTFPGFKVFTRKDGIEGVQSTRELRKGDSIKYAGRWLTRLQEAAIQKKNRNNWNSYIVMLDSNSFIDAHPRYLTWRSSSGESVGGRGLYLAGKFNEPNAGARANFYAEKIGGLVFLVAARAIRIGEELTWSYGDEYTSARTYPVGDDVFDFRSTRMQEIL